MPVKNSRTVRLVLIALGSTTLAMAGCQNLASWPGSKKGNNSPDYPYAQPNVEFPTLPPPGEASASTGSETNPNDAFAGHENQDYPSTNTPDATYPVERSIYSRGPNDTASSQPVGHQSDVAGTPGTGGPGDYQQGFFDPNYQDPSGGGGQFASGGSTRYDGAQDSFSGSSPSDAYGGQSQTPSHDSNTYGSNSSSSNTYDSSGYGSSPGSSSTYGSNSYGSSPGNSSTYGSSSPDSNTYNSSLPSDSTGSPYQGNTGGVNPYVESPSTSTSLPESSGSNSFANPNSSTTYPTTGAEMVTPPSSYGGATSHRGATSHGGATRRPDPNYRPAGTTRYQGLEGLSPSSSTHQPSSTNPYSSPSDRSWDAQPPSVPPTTTPSHYQQNGTRTAPSPITNSPLSLS